MVNSAASKSNSDSFNDTRRQPLANAMNTKNNTDTFQMLYKNKLTPPFGRDRCIIGKVPPRFTFFLCTRYSGVSRGFSGCPEPPPPRPGFFLIRGVAPLLAATLTSHLHLRRSETPLEPNYGYATALHRTPLNQH